LKINGDKLKRVLLPIIEYSLVVVSLNLLIIFAIIDHKKRLYMDTVRTKKCITLVGILIQSLMDKRKRSVGINELINKKDYE